MQLTDEFVSHVEWFGIMEFCAIKQLMHWHAI